MLVIKQLLDSIDFHCYQHSSKYLILYPTEETHTGLEQLKGEEMMREFSFFNYPSMLSLTLNPYSGQMWAK